MELLKLEYWNTCDIGGLIYQFGYHNIMYFDLDVGKPVIETIEEGVEDGEKNFISHFTKMVKKYKIETILPEYQFDAINFAALHDYKQITLNNGESARCLTFQVENKGWDDNGADVQVEISFSVDYIIKTNCCENNVQLSKCAVCQQTIQGFYKINGIEYNDPWNQGVLAGKYYMITGAAFTDPATLMLASTQYGWKISDRQPDQVCVTVGGINYKWYKDDSGKYRLYQYETGTLTGLNVNLKCYCYPHTWAQAYVSTNGGAYVLTGNPVYKSVAESLGITIPVLSGNTYDIKFYNYNNNCNYGYSNVLQFIVP